MSASTGPHIAVVHEEDEQKFTIEYDGDDVGFVQYLPLEDQRVFTHTEIDPEFSGMGLAVKLIDGAVEQTVADDKRIVPVCPFIVSYLRRHKHLSEHVDAATPELLLQLKKTS